MLLSDQSLKAIVDRRPEEAKFYASGDGSALDHPTQKLPPFIRAVIERCALERANNRRSDAGRSHQP